MSLEYDLDLSLTQVPENLIFYSDEQMTTAYLKENGAIHLDGTFFANDNNKTASKTIYWAWPIETGSTQTEINHNDELDSVWIGSDVIVGINATGKQIMENPNEKYTVTFDLNDGTLANHGDSEQITKQVTYGEAYGELPVPTKPGYRFVGWNGKNLIDFSKGWLYYASIVDDKVYLDASSVENNMGKSVRILRATNSSYIDTVVTKWSNGQCRYTFNKENSFNRLTLKVNTSKRDPTISLNIKDLLDGNQYTISFFIEDLDDARATLSNIQVEKGAEVTPYEPYILSSSTPVTQNKNHTLTAIWEEE